MTGVNTSHHKTSLTFAIITFLTFLQGCAPKVPEAELFANKKIAVPTHFPEYPGGGHAALIINQPVVNKSKGIVSGSSANIVWADIFTDPKLRDLITTALSQNQELKILEQEVKVAQNEILAKRGEVFPSFNVGLGYELEKVGEFTSQGASDKTAEYEPGKVVSKVLHNHEMGLSMSWEVDIWKKLRNATQSAYLKSLASNEVKKFAVTELVSEIASTYYELVALDRQLKIVTRFIDNLVQAKSMVEAQQRAARSTSLAVKRFQAEVLKNEGRVFGLQQAIYTTENRLNTLLGRLPHPIKRSDLSLTSYLPQNFYTGLPKQLLDNRPDIKEAKYQLMASEIDVKVAEARFYPSLSIDAGVGFEAFDSRHFLRSPQSVFYNLAGNLIAPIINRNAIKADFYSANYKQVQALLNYEKTFIKAYAEVANQLALIENTHKIYELRRKQVQTLSDSVEISNMLFRAARVDYVESLLTKRELMEAQMEQVEIGKQQLLSYVKLYRALGGGWQDAT